MPDFSNLLEVTSLLTLVVYSEEFELLKKPRGSWEELPPRAFFEEAIGRAHVAMAGRGVGAGAP